MNTLGATIVKRKGRSRTPTSVLVFDLDDKSVEYILGENKGHVLSNLYEKMKAGCKLLFVSKLDSVLKRLHQEVPFTVETHLLKDRIHINKLKEEVMKAVQQCMTDKIKPQATTYIGTLFEKEGSNHQSFKFGTVVSPSVYFAGLMNSKPVMQVEDSNHNHLSPSKTEEGELEHKELGYFDDLKTDSMRYYPLDETNFSDSSNPKMPGASNGEPHSQENQPEDLFTVEKQFQHHYEHHKYNQLNQIQLRKELPLLYTKIKDLTNRISGKLCLKLDQFKQKQTLPEDEPDVIKSPKSRPLSPLINKFNESISVSSLLGKRKRNFDDMFNEYMKDTNTQLQFTDDGIFDISATVKNSSDLVLKLKNINFEVLNEADTRPITKKLKKPEVRAGKENNEQSGSNQVIVEYKTSVPGEKQATLHVYGRDLQKLEPNVYVNDTIIQFYLKLVQSEFIPDDQKNCFYIYNTYLIEKLKANQTDKCPVEEMDFEKAYNSVKKWTKDVNIFEKEFLLFPMHDKGQKHWSLFIVCYPKYSLVKREPTVNGEKSGLTKPFILYFDSLGLLDINVAKLIATYLEYEAMHKQPEIYNEIKSNFNKITDDRMYQVIVPFQDNLTDCGLYLLEYAERFMMDYDSILDNIEENRDKLKLFPKSIFKTKRMDIANIILGLAKGNKEVLQEYPKTKRQRLENAKENPEEFEEIGDEELKEFISDEFHIVVDELEANTRDRLKLTCLQQLHEQRTLAGNQGRI